MSDSWTCVLVQEGPGMLSEDVCAALKASACELSLRKVDRMKISSDLCNGVIQTEWQTYAVGGRSGVLFRAQISEESGDYRVNFLLNEDDLERGAAFLKDIRERVDGYAGPAPDEFLIPELLVFYDLRKHKLH